MFLQSRVRNHVKEVLQMKVEVGVFSPGRVGKDLLFSFS